MAGSCFFLLRRLKRDVWCHKLWRFHCCTVFVSREGKQHFWRTSLCLSSIGNVTSLLFNLQVDRNVQTQTQWGFLEFKSLDVRRTVRACWIVAHTAQAMSSQSISVTRFEPKRHLTRTSHLDRISIPDLLSTIQLIYLNVTWFQIFGLHSGLHQEDVSFKYIVCNSFVQIQNNRSF